MATAAVPPLPLAPMLRLQETTQYRLLQASLLLVPVNWALGTTVPWFGLVFLLLGVSMGRFATIEWLFSLLAVALVGALLLAIPGDASLSRIIAALYNLWVLLTMIVLVNWGRRLDATPAAEGDGAATIGLYRAAFLVYLAYAAYMIAAVLFAKATGQTEVSFRALILGHVGGLPGILEMYAANTIVSTDWISSGPQLRVHGWAVYATASSLQFAVIGLLAAIYLVRRRRVLWAIAVELSILPLLVPMGSRTVGLAYVASLAFLLAVSRRGLVVGAVVLGPPALLGLALFGPKLMDSLALTLQGLADARSGSTEGRMLSYTTAIRMVLDTNVLTGLGVKPRDNSVMAIPIGSHSSIVSMFTRGGAVALLLLLAIHATLLARIVLMKFRLLFATVGPGWVDRAELVYLSRIVFIWIVWTVTEDFDAPLYPAALSALAIGIFWNMGNRTRTATLG